MSKLRAGVDELDIDLLQVLARGVLEHRLAEDEGALLDTNDGALEHEPVLLDLTVVDESTHRCDTLLGQISLGLTAGLVSLLSNAVDLLVDLGTVEVSVLTSAGNRARHTGRVPGSDTGNLTETTMGLTGQTRDAPTSGDTLVTVSASDSNDINLVVLVEHTVDGDFLFEQALGKVNLGSGISSVDLDLHDMSLLEAKVQLLDLGVSDDTDDGAELLDALQLGLDILATILLVLEGILGVSLFLGLVPVLVAATLELLVQVLGKDSRQGAETRWSLDVSNNTDDNHSRGLNDRDSIDNLTLVHDGTRAIDSADDVGHTGLVAAKGGQVGRILLVVLREGANASGMVLRTLLGKETQVTMAGSFELAMGPATMELVSGKGDGMEVARTMAQRENPSLSSIPHPPETQGDAECRAREDAKGSKATYMVDYQPTKDCESCKPIDKWMELGWRTGGRFSTAQETNEDRRNVSPTMTLRVGGSNKRRATRRRP